VNKLEVVKLHVDDIWCNSTGLVWLWLGSGLALNKYRCEGSDRPDNVVVIRLTGHITITVMRPTGRIMLSIRQLALSARQSSIFYLFIEQVLLGTVC